jgi:plastocyanin
MCLFSLNKYNFKIMKKLIGSKSRLLLGIGYLLTFLIISSSCTKKTMTDMSNMGTGSVGSGGPGTNEVWIQNMAFNPLTITVTAGTTIKWTNKDAVGHTVTSNSGLFDSGTISNSGIYSHLFSTAGSYPYHCTVHPSMTASVIVN